MIPGSISFLRSTISHLQGEVKRAGSICAGVSGLRVEHGAL